MASALLQAGGPSRLPTGTGQALGSAMPYAQQYARNGQIQLQQALMRLRQMSGMPNPGYPRGQ
jgi:hypothetical protein